jgi:hypothetical protein
VLLTWLGADGGRARLVKRGAGSWHANLHLGRVRLSAFVVQLDDGVNVTSVIFPFATWMRVALDGTRCLG